MFALKINLRQMEKETRLAKLHYPCPEGDLRILIPNLDMVKLAQALSADGDKMKSKTSRDSPGKPLSSLNSLSARNPSKTMKTLAGSLLDTSPMDTGDIVVTKLEDMFPSGKLLMSKLQKLPEYGSLTSRGRSESATLDISHRKLGNQHVFVLINGIAKNKALEMLLLKDNRISDSGFVGIFQTLIDSEAAVEMLDISENSIRSEGSAIMAQFLSSSTAIKKLSAQKMNINDNCLSIICNGLRQCSYLRTLILRENNISDEGASAIASILNTTSMTLTELDISWNKIQHIGLISLANSLAKNTTLESLDLSWNAGGTSSDLHREAANALSSMFASNKSLTHIDLSNNQLGPTDCTIISQGLALNHTLLGLHMTGNSGRLDAYGTLIPEVEPWPLEAGHCMTRIIGEKILGREKWMLRNNCWICGSWREVRFTYTLSAADIIKVLGKPYGVESGKDKDDDGSSGGDSNADSSPGKSTYYYSFPTPEQKLALAKKAEARQRFLDAQREKLLAVTVQLLTSFDNWVPEPMKVVLKEETNSTVIEQSPAPSPLMKNSSKSFDGNNSEDYSNQNSNNTTPKKKQLQLKLPSLNDAFQPLPSPLSSPLKVMQSPPTIEIKFELYRMVPPGR